MSAGVSDAAECSPLAEVTNNSTSWATQEDFKRAAKKPRVRLWHLEPLLPAVPLCRGKSSDAFERLHIANQFVRHAVMQVHLY